MSKLLFFDIDGTLAMPGRTVSRQTRDAIRAARANGHKAFICTGRSPELVNEDILSIGFDGGIFHAGGRAVIDGKTVYENHADAKMLDDVLPSIREHAVFYNYETTGGDFFSGFDPDILKEVQVEGANTELLRLIEALASPENRPVSDYAAKICPSWPVKSHGQISIRARLFSEYAAALRRRSLTRFHSATA